MHVEYRDILTKIFIYVKISRHFKDDISEVIVSNDIEENFGRRHCRIYINIVLKEESKRHYELQTAISTEFHKYFEKEYFSFYLGASRYNKDENDELFNHEEEIHYYYIYNILCWYLNSDKILVQLERFKNEWLLKLESEERRKEFREKREKINEVTKSLAPELGQIIAIPGHSALRLGRVTKINLPSHRQHFYLELAELKKSLDVGKVKMTHVSQNEIHAIIQPELLEKQYLKADLISLIEKGDSFSGLIWRRPQEYWKE